ncbi:MAG: 5'-nucleotidase [Balneolales bacterium]
MLIVSISACSTQEILTLQTGREYSENYEINDSIEPDDKMASFIEPFVAPIRMAMNRVITKSEGNLNRGKPEGTLGNLVADILRSRAMYEMRDRVDVAVMNNQRLLIDLPQGEITVGHIYELMPFDHQITVLKFTGNQILQIANEIAEVGGEPVSGMRMRIQDGKAIDVLVGSQEVELTRHYWLATSDWMANGCGELPTLWEPVNRVDYDILIRNTLIAYLDSKTTIQPKRDYRLR